MYIISVPKTIQYNHQGVNISMFTNLALLVHNVQCPLDAGVRVLDHILTVKKYSWILF